MLNAEQRVERMEQLLTAALSPSYLEVINESHKHIGHEGAKTGLGHFKIIISSKQFVGKTRIEQHQCVYLALGEMMKTDIHALVIEIRQT